VAANAVGSGARDLDPVDIARALTGDKDALANLVRRHWGRVFGFLVRLSGDYHLAQDLTQETFYRMWRALPQMQPTTPLTVWLYRTAHNAFVDHSRSWYNRRVVLDAVECESGRDPDPVLSLVERRFERNRALDLLAGLSPEHRAVLTLRFYEDLSVEEIAETLEVPVGTVKSRLHYAFRRLRERLLAQETDLRSSARMRRRVTAEEAKP